MWTCGEMKKKGWASLSKTLWTAVLVTLIFMLISGLFAGGQNVINILKITLQSGGTYGSNIFSNRASSASSLPALIIINLFQSLVGLAGLLATFFLINPLRVGYSRWFLTNHKEEGTPEIGLLFSSFKRGSYTGIVAGTAWQTLWLMIWSFAASACFIPTLGVFIAGMFSIVFSSGKYSSSSVSMNSTEFLHNLANIAPVYIILFFVLAFVGLIGYLAVVLNRRYAYFFTDLILAENPTFGAKNALDLSKKMTKGMKGHLFVLDLSFIGWWLLSSLTCGLLTLGVMPYIYATYTEVYMSRKLEQNL
jgi:uncharacterized membrane protein